MRLTCPNCGADYDVPEGMVSTAGRHVQCSTCHTRWFVRGTDRAPASEEQILARLENWRPRPVQLVPPSAAEPPAGPPTAGEPTPPPTRRRPAEPPRLVPGPAAPAAPPAAPPTGAPAAPPTAIPAAPSAAPPVAAVRRELPTKPAARPTVARPASVSAAPPRPAPRLDLVAARTERAPEVAREPEPEPRNLFPRGFLLVLALGLVAFAAYRFATDIAAAVPAAAPALDAYAATVDGWRFGLEAVVGPYRPDAG